MLLSAVLIWTSTWPSILWSWWVQTLRTLSALSLLKAAMERSTLITTGEDPDKGCAPHAGIWMSYLPAKDVLQGHPSGVAGWNCDESICLAHIWLRLSSKTQLAASCCLTWLAVGKDSGVWCGVGFCKQLCEADGFLEASLTFYAVFV